jgi:hypothetical protein
LCFRCSDGVQAARLRFDSWQEQEIFNPTAFILALALTQPPSQKVPGTLSLGIKQPGRESDFSPPPSIEVKNIVVGPPHPICLHIVVLREIRSKWKLIFRLGLYFEDKNLRFISFVTSKDRNFFKKNF